MRAHEKDVTRCKRSRSKADLRGLSIRNPWPWYILEPGGKDVENRTWSTTYRGTVLVHASKGWSLDEWHSAALFASRFDRELVSRCPEPRELPAGAVVGVVELVRVIAPGSVRNVLNASDWYTGDYGLVLANPRRLPEPIPWRGALGLWRVPDGLRQQVAQL